ncbi:MAG: elongation factor P [Planctomycetota bacterium]
MVANDLKKGMTINHSGSFYEVAELSHMKPGKGAAVVRAKLKNLFTENILDYTYRSDEKVEQVISEKKKYEYLYKDGNHYYFMDPQTYENIPVGEDKLGDNAKFLKENETVTFFIVDNQLIRVNIPDFIVLEIVKADPAIRGDTATNVTKKVELETGAVIQCPMFLNIGDKVKIDTRTGTYIERM